jgi:hypothetical protein
MNAAGLKFFMTGVADTLNSPIWYGDLTGEGVSADELKGTQQDATALLNTINNTPPEQIEQLVAEFDGVLTHALEKFQQGWQSNRLQGFRDAQVMLGFVRSLFNKAGIRT